MSGKEIYFSFFMFTSNVKPHDEQYRETVVRHIKELASYGYTGFEFPIAAPNETEHVSAKYAEDLVNYTNLRRHLDQQGLSHIKISTNVGVTPTADPSSSNPETQRKALEYLKSRVDITQALGGEIMMGPIIVPYAAFPEKPSSGKEPKKEYFWSDELQEQLKNRYDNARPILNELGKYAETKKVKLAIEPITHWETPAPNKLSQLIQFLGGVQSKQVGVVIDSAHEILDGDGPEIFKTQVEHLAREGRLHYIQISPPDRGAVHTSWIPWQSFLEPIVPVYKGPFSIEVFNAIPEFQELLRLTRRKFWIPGEDSANAYPSAYQIAKSAIEITQKQLSKIQSK
ncbi:sugar phosphate isomerase/epimerase family protein [Cylindrospermopsis raciborskii]|uniref:sugar phosphate isomerase/epimerase family protein n=1 Tax=Cylindrospermopsis raciborskii TaxID=77022 RepID=UPI000E1F89B0|nr:sugar phosphate isomerase/epimerase family protein [Cylindrospermopsis raciborskii]UJL32439.1 sugar phosphate isomerase/epimerase [Cylindrospermopsis raciborskii Cr2010]UJS04889.1 sugar phosphate isomerase/epimerase [Cylindrospermopsis raciborskii KLL07]